MSEPQITWTGTTPEDLTRRMRAHPFAATLEPLMQKATLLALRASQPLTPVDTGTLRRSETTRVETGGLRGWIGSNVVYAPFVHEGARGTFSRPFFSEGIEAATPDIQRLLTEAGDLYFQGIAK
jgi:hypothetical protein